MAPQLASALASVSPLVQAGAMPPQRAPCPFSPQQLDIVRGVMQQVALQPDLLALPELTFVNEFLSCVGGRGGCTSALEAMLKGLKGTPAQAPAPAPAFQSAPAAPLPVPAPVVPATVNEMESMASVLSVLDEISSQTSTPRSTTSATPMASSFATAQPPPPLCLQVLNGQQGQPDCHTSPATTPQSAHPSTPSPSSAPLPFAFVSQAGATAPARPQPAATQPPAPSVGLQNILVPCAPLPGVGASGHAKGGPPAAASAPAAPAQPTGGLMGLLQPVSSQGGAQVTEGMKDDEKANIDPRKYKTRMCRNWVKEGRCTYEHTCCFAHGEAELRNSAANICVLSSLAYFKSKQEGEEE